MKTTNLIPESIHYFNGKWIIFTAKGQLYVGVHKRLEGAINETPYTDDVQKMRCNTFALESRTYQEGITNE